jgi:hypothetical protein
VTCQEAGENIAVAVLTRSDLDAATATHLQGCADCRREHESMTALPALLDLVGPGSAPEPAPPELLDRLLVVAAEQRRGRRRTGLLAAAASVVVLVALAAFGLVAIRNDTTPPVFSSPVIDRQAADPVTGVSAHVWVRPGAWGSRIRVSIDGVKPDTTCTLTVIGVDGHREVAATWKASYAGTASVDGTVSGPPASLAELEVADQTGHVLVPVPLQ